MAIGDGPAKLVGINWPGGFHHLYAKMAPLFQVAGPPDFGALAAAAAEHGAEILGPPLAHLESAGGCSRRSRRRTGDMGAAPELETAILRHHPESTDPDRVVPAQPDGRDVPAAVVVISRAR